MSMSDCPSVRPSVTVRHTRIYIKTAQRVIEILSLSDRLALAAHILVFRHQGLLRKSDG